MLTNQPKEEILKNLESNKLFSYTIPYDDGAAPNPFWNICTLVICKPVIRRTAEVGDWIVGLGSKNSPMGDLSEKIIYIMLVTKKISMREYNNYCKQYLPNKIPDIQNQDQRRHVGDCIYDFSVSNEGKLRPGVHTEENRPTDLRGKNALLSSHFYYFGDNPIDLQPQFHSMIKSNQGHKSTANDPVKYNFIKWLFEQNLQQNYLYGNPQMIIDLTINPECISECSKKHRIESELDESTTDND